MLQKRGKLIGDRKTIMSLHMKEKLSSIELNMLLPSAFADPLSSKHLPSTTKEKSIQLS
jgi:hypothetical protein